MARTPATAPRLSTFSDSEWKALARFWHPVARSAQVKDKPVAARLLDENLVVFRTSHGVTVARDLCLHRGAKLSLGEMAGDNLVCGFRRIHYTPTTRASARRSPRIPASLSPGSSACRPSRARSATALSGPAFPAIPSPPSPTGPSTRAAPTSSYPWTPSIGTRRPAVTPRTSTTSPTSHGSTREPSATGKPRR